jgi:hypothetical protein
MYHDANHDPAMAVRRGVISDIPPVRGASKQNRIHG